MGFLKSLLGQKVPTLNSYSDIYDLAFDYITNNKNKKDLITILKQAISLNKSIKSDDIFKLNSVASWLENFKEFDDVKVICSRILKIDPKNYLSISLLLSAALNLKDDQKQIISICNQLLDSDYEAHIEVLQLTLQSNIPVIKNSIKNVADTFSTVGYIFANSKVIDKSKIAYEIAYKIDPTYFEAHHNIGISLYYLKRYNEAMNSFMRDIEILESTSMNPVEKNQYLSRIFFNMGKALFRMNQILEARTYLEKSAKLEAHYEKPSDINKSVEELIAIIKNDPEL